MSTVAKIFVISGLVVIAFNASGGVVVGLFLLAIGLVFPREKPQDTSLERIEGLEAYVRDLHRWIVEREAASTGPVAQTTAAADTPIHAAEVSAASQATAERQAAGEPTVEPAPQKPISADTIPFAEPLIADAIAAEVPEAEPDEDVAAAAFSPVTPALDGPAADATTPYPMIAPAARAAREEPAPPRRSLFDFEQILGTNWLAKVGVAILVLGVSFFLAWQLRELGPAGKVTVGTIVGFVMLGAGIWFERNERYRVLARAALGGGWALLFFVSWAAHHVTATRIIDSPPVALALMLLVSGAMVVHTLRYRSQVVTGLAFVLAFSTVAVNQADVYGLTANVVLALAFSAVVARMRWFELEIVGIAAAYLNHYLWLRPIVLPEQGSLDAAASAGMSVTILLLYWAIFRASFVIRRAPDEKASVIAGLLNSGLLVAVLKAHPASPDVAFQLLLALGVIELVLSRLPRIRRRRHSFIALTTLGTMFITAAIPLRFAPASVTVTWLVNAIILSVVGILTRERVYRRLGTLIATATAFQLILFPLGRVLIDGLGKEAPAAQRPIGFIALAVAAWLLVEATLLVRRWSELYPEPIERYLVRALGYLALAIVLPAGWLLFPQNGTAVFWAGAALVLALAGRRMANSDLALHATLLGAAAALRALGHNLAIDGPALELGSRAVTVTAVAFLLYALARAHGLARNIGQKLGHAGGLWTGTGLLALLAASELPSLQLALAWAGFALALAQLGRRFDSHHLTVQANLVAAAAAIQVVVVNLPSNAVALENPWPVSWRIPVSLTVVVLLYALAKWNRDAAPDDDESSFGEAWRDLAPFVPQWGGTALLVLLAWYELLPAAVAVAWTIIAMVLMETGLRRGSRSLVLQANALFVVTFGRVFVVNMNIDDFGAIGARVWTIAPIAAALVHAYWRSDDEIRERRLAPRWFPPLLAWLGIACVTALLRFQLASDAVVVGWAALTLLLFAFASMSGRRIFAHMAIAVTLLTLARAGLHNFYERSYFPSPGALDRWMWVGGAAALLFAALPFAFRLRTEAPQRTPNWLRNAARWLDARPEQLLFFVPLLLVTVLIGFEMRSGMLTVAWGLEGVLVFVFALLVRERTFRLSGLALLLLCVGKIFALDFWALTLRDKALTGIIIGLALIGVSVLYSRKRETILKYL